MKSSTKKAAKASKKNVCVFAGAGSGKTRRLIQRFIEAVTVEKIEPERILAITFTDSAANQMKSRLVSEFSKRGLHTARRKLENSSIGTIHSFCARFLRENPIECGIDPFFQILSDGESEVLKKKQMDRLFESSIEKPSWISLLAIYGETSVRQAIERFYETSHAFADGDEFFLKRNFTDQKKEAHRRFTTLLKKFVSELDQDKLSGSEDGLRSASLEILRHLESQKSGWENFRTLGEGLGLLHKKVPRRKEAVEEIKAAASVYQGYELIDLGAVERLAFVEMAAAFKASYESEKRKIACYDFDDLVSLVHGFFESKDPKKEDLKDRVRSHFKLVLVDECQDLSLLQAKLIRAVSKESGLFLVGDAQQAIYGFRFADPEVFEDLSKALPKNLTEHEKLFDNYRTEPKLLKLINNISSRIMGDAFTPLEPKKPSGSKDGTLIEVISVEKSGSMELEEARLLEAQTLAQHVRSLVDTKRFHYKDIAVLFRTLSSSDIYENAFAKAGIPYFLLRNKGFYERAEIMDLIYCLRFAKDPHEDIALAAVLRSPLVGLSENALFWLSHSVKKENGNTPLSLALNRIPEQLSETDRNKLRKFKTLIDWLQRSKNKKSLYSLLDTILRETDYEAKILALDNGRQALANVRKFCGLVEGLEKKGLIGIEEISSFLEGLTKEREESSAKLEGGEGDIVAFSTVHAAKGLEYPCVIIADMGSQPKKNDQGAFAFSAPRGIGFKVTDTETWETYEDAVYTAIKSDLKEKRSAEDRRLFYVAMTRAKERLIFSGVNKEDSWMGRFLKVMEDEKMEGIHFLEPSPQKTGQKVTVLSENEPVRKKLIEAKLFSAREAEETGIGWNEAEFQKILSRFTLPSKVYDALEDTTVTELVASQNSSSIVFLEEKESEAPDLESDALPRNEYGSIYHKVMEFLVNQKPSRLSMQELLPASARRLSAPERKELEESVRRFWAGPWGSLIKNARRRYTELPFLYKTKHGILKGQIDLVLQEKDGSWAVLDYKTNRIDPKEIAKAGEEYRMQLLLYSFVFFKLYGAAVKKGVLYFSHIHESLSFEYRQEDFTDIESRLDALFAKAVEVKSS